MNPVRSFTQHQAVFFIFSFILLLSVPSMLWADQERLNINEATAKQFETLPGIGKTTAKRIVELRETQGPFKQIEELQHVKGIGKAKFAKIKDLITVGISAKSSSK